MKRVFSEDELKEIEKYAAEMKVVKFNMEDWRNTQSDVCDAISTGLGRNVLLNQVTLLNILIIIIPFILILLVSS